MFGGSLWCLLFLSPCHFSQFFLFFCLLFHGVDPDIKASLMSAADKMEQRPECPLSFHKLIWSVSNQCLINVWSMSDQCQINVRSMSVQCLFNVRPMSYQFLINIRSMSDQCQTNSWYILSFWSISLEFLICFSDQWQKLPISNLTFLSLSTNRLLKFMSSDQYGTNIDWIL